MYKSRDLPSTNLVIVLIVWLVAHYPLQAAGGVVAGTGLELYVVRWADEIRKGHVSKDGFSLDTTQNTRQFKNTEKKQKERIGQLLSRTHYMSPVRA